MKRKLESINIQANFDLRKEIFWGVFDAVFAVVLTVGLTAALFAGRWVDSAVITIGIIFTIWRYL